MNKSSLLTLKLKRQLEKLEEVANKIVALKRAEGHIQVRTKPAVVIELQKLATLNLSAQGSEFVTHLNAILTKVRTDLWPRVSNSMRSFAMAPAATRLVLLEQIRGELMDAEFIYPAVALSCHAPIDQPAEAAEIIRAQAQGITIVESKRWPSAALKENIVFQRTQLEEIITFLDQVAEYRQMLEANSFGRSKMENREIQLSQAPLQVLLQMKRGDISFSINF